MAFHLTVKPFVFALFICLISGSAYEEEVPRRGTGLAGYDPFTGSVAGDEPETGTGVAGGVPQTGAGIFGEDPAQIVAKALLCFNDKQIYSSCEESYRLTQTGNLNVPSEYVDPYCSGPCLTETHLVLNCLENVMAHFLFYNRATVRDIKDTIKAGCSYGPERGHFDVAEHIQAEENIGYKTVARIIPVIAFGIIANALFF
ncbi:Glycine-rich protein family [Euphorbia peplus]|nr:Glycine-rich protein family [Euphorbia peplus]